MQKQKIIFIVNPISGTGKQKYVEKAVEQYLDKSMYDAEIWYTRYAGHARELSAEAVRKGADVVVATGGDGSINEVAGGLIHTNVKLGVIPIGSGNGFARCLNIPLQVKNAVQVLNKGVEKRIDTVKINEHFFLSIAGVGYDANVAAEYAKVKKRGFFAYLRIVLMEYAFYKPKRYRLFYEGKQLAVRALFISFANGNQFGYDLPIAPDATIDDGHIDVCIVRKPPFWRVLGTGLYFLFQQLDRSKYVQYLRVEKITLKQRKPHYTNIDGDAVMMPQEINIESDPKSLIVIVPKNV